MSGVTKLLRMQGLLSVSLVFDSISCLSVNALGEWKMKTGIFLAGAVIVSFCVVLGTRGRDPAPKDPKPVFRMEERRFPQSDAKLIAPKQGRDDEIQGGQIVSQFRVSADGTYAYDGVRGKIAPKAIAGLTQELAKMTNGLTAAPIDRSVAFYYADADGKERCRLFTFPGSSPDCEALLKKLAAFKVE
jgi:hypothetical protein